jgi:hypothetical protein
MTNVTAVSGVGIYLFVSRNAHRLHKQFEGFRSLLFVSLTGAPGSSVGQDGDEVGLHIRRRYTEELLPILSVIHPVIKRTFDEKNDIFMDEDIRRIPGRRRTARQVSPPCRAPCHIPIESRTPGLESLYTARQEFGEDSLFRRTMSVNP